MENFKNPVGIYRNADKVEIGCIDPAQADAVVERGFSLVRQCANAQEVTELLAKKAEKMAETQEVK
jgi:hypothetical protein